MIWAYLIHLSANMWGDCEDSIDYYAQLCYTGFTLVLNRLED